MRYAIFGALILGLELFETRPCLALILIQHLLGEKLIRRTRRLGVASRHELHFGILRVGSGMSSGDTGSYANLCSADESASATPCP
jgi:hypothetical protein